MPPPSLFTPILLFYPAQGDAQRFWRTNMSDLLKKSLSEVLTDFYPMAGRFENNWSILCNDEGVGYIEARVKAPYTLNQLLNNTRGEELNRLLPCDMYGIRAAFDKLAAIQVTVFDACGGMVIGVSLSHALADAASLAMFVKSWAAAARLDASVGKPPKFGFDSLFPPRDIPVPQATDYTEEIARSLLQPKNIISKNFVFHQKQIAALKASIDVDHSPTRVEAVCALVLKCFINATDVPSAKSIMLSTAINLRNRMSPRLGTHHFGNLALPWTMEHTGLISLNDLAVRLKELMRQIDNDLIEKLQADSALLLIETLDWWMNLYTMTDVELIHLTSWCKFPFYEIDFGWGEPAWGAPCYPSHPCITLIDTKNGGGIEAWVTL